MNEEKRVCGRKDCTECPRQRVGRCQTTPAQRDAHECRCGLRDKRAQQEQNR